MRHRGALLLSDTRAHALGDSIDQAAAEQGAESGALAAGSLLGPEAAPVGALVGGYVGGHASEWAKGAWGTFKGWLSSDPAPCECQLGACGDNGDDTYHPEKDKILASQCEPKSRAIIDKIMNDRYAALIAAGNSAEYAGRENLCGRLGLYAKCRDEGWKVPEVPDCAENRHWDAAAKGCVCNDGFKPDPSVAASGGGSSPCVPAGESAATAGGAGAGAADSSGSGAGAGAADSSGSGVGTVVGVGLGAAALYAGIQLLRGKPVLPSFLRKGKR